MVCIAVKVVFIKVDFRAERYDQEHLSFSEYVDKTCDRNNEWRVIRRLQDSTHYTPYTQDRAPYSVYISVVHYVNRQQVIWGSPNISPEVFNHPKPRQPLVKINFPSARSVRLQSYVNITCSYPTTTFCATKTASTTIIQRLFILLKRF